MNSKKTVSSALVILAVLFSALALPSASLAAGGTCDPGTVGDDDITCTGDITGDVNAGEGDDSITIADGAIVTGDVQGDQGADTIVVEEGAIVDGELQGNVDSGSGISDLADEITNNGTVTGEIFGGAGADIITNNGDVGEDIIGGGGADLIINSGDVEGKIDGYDGDDTIVNSGSTDDIWGSGGDDTITNSGTVDGDITGNIGDDIITNTGTVDYISGNSGNDTITNSGTVTGDVELHSGDDTVTLETGVQIGGMIEGAGCDRYLESQTDTLIFNMSTYDAAEYNAAQAVIAGATDEYLDYNFAWDGGTIAWQYFDTLTDNLSLLFKAVASAPSAKPVAAETATLVVEDKILKIFQNDESSTLRFYAVTPEGDIYITELPVSAWEYAQADAILLNVSSTILETELVVTMLESGRLQVEYKSSGGAVLFLTDIAP